MTTNTIALDKLAESRLNPRKDFDSEQLDELTASVKEHGVLQPILVRPHPARNGVTHEIVAGHRRYRAAKAAGLAEIPVVVREIADDVMLELMLTENLRRADLHPMEEAQGYGMLHRKHGRSVEDIAAKVGKSPSYVYDRMKLCELGEEAQKDFLANRFTAGHAVLLARLTPKDQDRALAALYEGENPLFHDEDYREGKEREGHGMKARSVRELKAWIDGNVRFDVEAVDQMVFPETAARIETAVAEEAKVLAITHEHYVRPDARGGKTLSCKSWKRADGQERSKKCEHAQLAVVVAGPGRGDSFDVCVKKDKCKVHWAKEQREKVRRAAGAQKAKGGGHPDKWEREEARRKAQREREAAEQARYKKALPAIREAFVARIKELEPKASGPLGQILLSAAYGYGDNRKKLQSVVPAGPAVEDLLRHLVYVRLCANALSEWRGALTGPETAKTLGIDLKKILDEHAPVGKPAKAKKGKGVQTSGTPGTCRVCGCQEDSPCEGGCAWADKTETLCTACADGELEEAAAARKAKKKAPKRKPRK